MPTTPSLLREQVHQRLKKAFIPRNQRSSVLIDGSIGSWIFDFRPLLLDGETLDSICDLVWETLETELPYQVGGLETAAIALVSGLLMKARSHNSSLTGFYIRKSRRKDGLQQHVEGNLTNEKIILVDDTINSGRSFMRQVEALAAEGKKVSVICVLVRFRDESFYTYFKEKGIRIISLFTIDDFPESGGIKKLVTHHPTALPANALSLQWKFASPHPSFYTILPKSAPALDTDRLYFGADNGVFWALNQTDGSEAWHYQTLFGAGKKRIFSSPAVSQGMVFFGAYDGNLHALDAATGKKKWLYAEADWIGSSPCIDASTNTLYIGLEFGLWKKQGGLVALDTRTGNKKWMQPIETLVHSSPALSQRHRVVIVGSTSGLISAFRATDGAPAWMFQANGPVRAGFATCETLGLTCFGSADRSIYVINTSTGERVYSIETFEPIYSTPLVVGTDLFFGLLDKRCMCIDLTTGTVRWTHWAHSRIFATPVMIEGSIFIGSNDGRLYELDRVTGKERGYTQFTERIVNGIAYNPSTARFFVPTYANEIYGMTRPTPSHYKIIFWVVILLNI
jgi:outer membrane protein assembly factor BamB